MPEIGERLIDEKELEGQIQFSIQVGGAEWEKISSWMKIGRIITLTTYILASLGMLVITGAIVINILGRLFFSKPLLGMVEIVGMGGVFLIPFAIILAERNRAHIVVKIVTSFLPAILQVRFHLLDGHIGGDFIRAFILIKLRSQRIKAAVVSFFDPICGILAFEFKLGQFQFKRAELFERFFAFAFNVGNLAVAVFEPGVDLPVVDFIAVNRLIQSFYGFVHLRKAIFMPGNAEFGGFAFLSFMADFTGQLFEPHQTVLVEFL